MKTLIFCTSYAEHLSTWNYRWRRWVDAIQASRLVCDELLIVDDGSPILPNWRDTAIITEGQSPSSEHIQSIYHFTERRGQRPGPTPFPGWYRSFAFACHYGIQNGFDKLIHVEADAFIISANCTEYLNSLRNGWTSLWCTRHDQPESTIQVICKDHFDACSIFFSRPYEEYNQDSIEKLIPFTHSEKSFIGDRYGEFLKDIPKNADYATQVLWDQHESYFWWLTSKKNNSRRLIGLSMVKNEVDIIEPFVEHHLELLDYIILIDNASIDGTRNVLKLLSQKHNRLIIADIPSLAYSQSERMTLLYQSVAEILQPDYVLFLDADEFLNCIDRDALIDSLSAIVPGTCGLIAWSNYVLHPNEQDTTPVDPPRSLRWRRRLEIAPRYKLAIRLDGASPEQFIIEQGNHSARRHDNSVPQHKVVKNLSISHYPVRSIDQLVSKVVVGWNAYLAKNRLARLSGEGYHWRELFDSLVTKEKILYSDLCKVSYEYDAPKSEVNWNMDVIIDPPNYRYQRKLTSGHSKNAVSCIGLSWEAAQVQDKATAEIVHRSGKSDAPSTFYVDLPPVRYLIDRHTPSSILDLSNEGLEYCNLANSFRIPCSTSLNEEPSINTNFSRDYNAADLGGELINFDLTLCLELLHRFPVDESHKILREIGHRTTRVIVFSAARPNQPGPTPLTRLSIRSWLSIWMDHGWSPDLDETLAARCLASLPWIRQNLVVLKPTCQVADPKSAIRELCASSSREARWGDISPGVRKYILSEEPLS